MGPLDSGPRSRIRLCNHCPPTQVVSLHWRLHEIESPLPRGRTRHDSNLGAHNLEGPNRNHGVTGTNDYEAGILSRRKHTGGGRHGAGRHTLGSRKRPAAIGVERSHTAHQRHSVRSRTGSTLPRPARTRQFACGIRGPANCWTRLPVTRGASTRSCSRRTGRRWHRAPADRICRSNCGTRRPIN